MGKRNTDACTLRTGTPKGRDMDRTSLRLPRRGLFLTSLIAGAILLGCSGPPDAAPVGGNSLPPAPVQLAEAKPGPIRATLTYSGAIQSSQQVSLSPRVPGQVAQILVGVGTPVRAGDRLASLDPGTIPSQVAQAQANLQAAQARLDQLLTGPKAHDVAAAQSAYDAAQAALNRLLNPNPSDRAQADAAVTSAQTALTNAEAAVNSTRATLLSTVALYCNTWPNFGIPCGSVTLPLPPDVIASIQSSLTTRAGDPLSENGTRANAVLGANAAHEAALASVPAARDGLAAARGRRQALLNPTPNDLAQARAAVDGAKAALENRTNPYTDADIQGARAGVAQAQAALAMASTTLDQTNVVAPFDGVVAQKLAEVGSAVSPGVPMFVISARAVEVRLTVEEARVGLVRPDMDAVLSVAAFPGKTFPAKVASVAPTGDQRAHTFEVKVFAQDPASQLLPGMFAEVQMVTTQKTSALLVPSAAILQQGQARVVVTVVDGKAAFRPVQLGVADQVNTEITGGLKAGELVVVVGQNTLRDGQAVVASTPTTPQAAPQAPAPPRP